MAAYLVAICKITNPHERFKQYAERSAELLHRHGGKYLVRGSAQRVLKGELLADKAVIVAEFPSLAALTAFVEDPEYVNEVAPLREGSGEYDYAVYESPPPELV